MDHQSKIMSRWDGRDMGMHNVFPLMFPKVAQQIMTSNADTFLEI